MASAGPSGGSVTELASKLYDACLAKFSPDHLFYQQELLGLGQKNDRLAWKIISREDAEKLQNLSPDESLVYNVIHSTGRSGIWVRAIQNRTNLHKSILDRCLKSLEGKNYIKSVHNVKFPSRKMYMLAGLAPSEDVTGGAWFTDGVLDENFINTVAGYIEYTVSRKSWFEVASADGHRGKRVKTADGSVSVKQEMGQKEYIPFPAGYQGYPTVAMITAAVNESGITPVRLGEESILQLLEMLCFDNRLVALNNGEVYRSVKKPRGRETAASTETSCR
ncbi:RPC34 RNA polymerase subunit family protein [Aspergillus tanneri]|uniref:DNA-directed RNA polymerase III subunit RPC6 n=1 Tax=Aspergillus tanneri TaxID=1220188 RepID=A0A5M9MMB9_9EURO|nr:34-kDa subunit of RNA polymerase III (C) [Aspergillus tanneri]KAA8645599.1 34-kDa subunit of RNA polymerase III (C) [Aspergillus tanneri]